MSKCRLLRKEKNKKKRCIIHKMHVLKLILFYCSQRKNENDDTCFVNENEYLERFLMAVQKVNLTRYLIEPYLGFDFLCVVSDEKKRDMNNESINGGETLHCISSRHSVV